MSYQRKKQQSRIISLRALVVIALAFLVVAFSPIKYKIQGAIITHKIGEPVKVESISNNKYAYNQLPDNEKLVYDQMLNCLLNHEENAVVSAKSEDEIIKVFDFIRSDQNNIFWVDGYSYQTYYVDDSVYAMVFIPTYIMSYEERKNYENQVESVVSQWLEGINPEADDYTKTKYVYEKLIEKVDYVKDSPFNQNILSVFLDGETVCQGYAMACSYLLEKLDVPSTVIMGLANDEPHAWNLVLLDGDYYYIDVTWGNSTYRDGDKSQKHINYGYLNANTLDIAGTHISGVGFDIPNCTANRDNYFVKEGLYFDTWDASKCGQALKKAYESGIEGVSMRFSTKENCDAAKKYLLIEKHFSDYCEGLRKISYFTDSDMNVLTFRFK